MTRREANCILGLLAGGGAFVPASSIVMALDIPQASVLSAISAVSHRLSQEITPTAFIEHKRGFGYILYGKGDRLDALYHEAMRAIAEDAALVAADDKAARILPRPIGFTPNEHMAVVMQ